MEATVKAVPEHDAEDETFDVPDLARMFKCSISHIYTMRDAKKLPRSLKLGQLIRWRRSVIRSWMAAGCPRV